MFNLYEKDEVLFLAGPLKKPGMPKFKQLDKSYSLANYYELIHIIVK